MRERIDSCTSNFFNKIGGNKTVTVEGTSLKIITGDKETIVEGNVTLEAGDYVIIKAGDLEALKSDGSDIKVGGDAATVKAAHENSTCSSLLVCPMTGTKIISKIDSNTCSDKVKVIQ